MSDFHNTLPSYLDNAAPDEKQAFFHALICLAYADGNCDEDELAYITEAAKVRKMENIAKLLQPKTTAELLTELEVIKNKHLAMELIREMCALAHVDSELSDSETLLIGKVGLKLGLSLDKIEQISNWVIDRMIWQEQAKIIFEENEK